MSPSSRRGPAANRTPSKQRSDQAAPTAGNATDADAEDTRPGVDLLLDRLAGVKRVGGRDWHALCPAHPDRKASLRLTVKVVFGRWALYGRCTGCSVSLPDMIRDLGLGVHRVLNVGNDGYSRPTGVLPPKPLPSPDRIRAWMNHLDGSPALLRYVLEERGLSRRIVRQYHVGFDEGLECFVLPVYEDGRVVNLRRYRPNLPPGEKMRSLQGHGSPPRLYPPLPSDKRPVVVAEGEWDALVARRHGLLAVTGTGGARAWQAGWSPAMADRHVAIAYDCDEAGRTGALVTATAVAPFARSVRVVDLGLGDKQDLTDWFVKHGRSVDDLRALINATPVAGVGQ